MSGEKILIVDDDLEIRDIIRLYLSREGFQVFTAGDWQSAGSLVELEKPDLIILDVLLPELDGIELCLQLRRKTRAPILFLSCKGEEMDKIIGLTAGGDDYITKPFMPGELTARVKAHLRRSRLAGEEREHDQILEFAGLRIDLRSCEVIRDGRQVTLSAKEFALLSILAGHPNRVFPMEQLFQFAWKDQPLEGDARTVMVHISNLRKKIEAEPARPRYIRTVKGVGYKFCGE